ncbi:MAG: glycosyltransferase [Rhodothermales bacterium]
MKVLIVHNTYRFPGGEDVVVESDLHRLRDAGHTVDLWTVGNDALRDAPSPALAANTIWNRSMRREAFNRVRAHGYDVVHVHNTMPRFSPAILGGFREAGAAVVQSLHNYRLVCPAGTLFRDGRVCTDCTATSTRWPAVAHGCYRDSRPASAVVAAMLGFHEARGTWTNDVDAFVAVSGFVRDVLADGGLPAERIHVLPNSLGDLPPVLPEESSTEPSGSVTDGSADRVLFAGRLVAEKGIPELLAAWQGVAASGGPPRTLVILGDGPLRDEVEQAARTLDGTAWPIDFRGQVDRHALLDAMAHSAWTIVPSRWHEPFGMVAIESLAMGTPVLVTPVGGLAELAEQMPGVRLAGEDLAASLQEVLESGTETWKARAERARAARDRFSSARGLERLEEIYRAARARLAAFAPLVAIAGLLLFAAVPFAQAAPPQQKVIYIDADAAEGGNGSAVTPFRTFHEALAIGQPGPGDTLRVHPGIYRESIRPALGGASADARLAIVAVEPGTAIVSGADILPGDWFEMRDAEWILTGMAGAADTSLDVRPRPEQLFVDDMAYRHVGAEGQAEPGTFRLERSAGQTVLVVTPLPEHTSGWVQRRMEWAVRGQLFEPQPSTVHGPAGDTSNTPCRPARSPGWYHVEGLVFERAANALQVGAVCAGSEGSRFVNIEVRQTASVGMYVHGIHHEIQGSRFNHNGQAGLNGRCTGCRITDNRTSDNNWKRINPLWEAGGGKWTQTFNTVFRRHVSTDNEGPGLWLDETNEANRIEDGFFDNNLLAGILLELRTTRTEVTGNHVRRTRRHEWSGAGILVQAASDNTLQGNRIENNDGAGIWLRGDHRAPDGGSVIQGNVLMDNVRVPGNDFSEISIVADSTQEFTSIRMRDNEIHNLAAPGYFFRIRDADVRHTGNDESAFETIRQSLASGTAHLPPD